VCCSAPSSPRPRHDGRFHRSDHPGPSIPSTRVSWLTALEETGLLNELPGPSTLFAPIDSAWDKLPKCLTDLLNSPQPTRNLTLRRLLKTLFMVDRHWVYSQFEELPQGTIIPTWLPGFSLEVVFKTYPQVMTKPPYLALAEPVKQVCFQGIPNDGSPSCVILADVKITSMLITHLVDNFPFWKALCPKTPALLPPPSQVSITTPLTPSLFSCQSKKKSLPREQSFSATCSRNRTCTVLYVEAGTSKKTTGQDKSSAGNRMEREEFQQPQE